jgi:hypothetical protein
MAENILRLKIDSQEYDAKLKRASDGLTKYVDGCRKCGGTLEVVEKDTLNYVKALGNMETASRTAKGKLGEMTKAFTDLSMQYRQMTDAEKASPFGKAMSQSLDQLKSRINSYKSQLNEVNKSIGESSASHGKFGEVIGALGSKLGVNSDLLSIVTTGTIGTTAAIGAGVAAIAAATKAWAEYNEELAKNDNTTRVTLGLPDGSQVEKITDDVKALADTYNVDFRDAINAVNTLMQQFGLTSDQAFSLVRQGLQGMIEGDGPKLLSMIQEYAPAFRDAGISASQLVAIIHNSEGGIFTDSNMNAIVMGIKNIRLMTSATSEALKKVGIDGEEMTRKLNDGTMTIFQAMQLVLSKLEDTKSSSQAAGEVMQTVFGRQGVYAGTNLAKAINTLNLNLQDTKKQTGEYGEQMDKVVEGHQELNKQLRITFGFHGWEKMSSELKSSLYLTLAKTVELARELAGLLAPGGGAFVGVNAVATKIGQGRSAKGRFGDASKENFTIYKPGDDNERRKSHYLKMKDGTVIKSGQTYKGRRYDWNVGGKWTSQAVPSSNVDLSDKHSGRGSKGGRTATRATTHTTAKQQLTEEQTIAKRIDALSDEYVSATEQRKAAIRGEIKMLQTRAVVIKRAKDEAKGIAPKATTPATRDYSAFTTSNITAYLSDLKKQIDQSTIGSTLYDKLTEKMRDATTLKDLLNIAMQNGIDGMDADFSEYWKKALNSDNIPEDDLKRLVDDLNDKLAALGLGQVSINKNTGAASLGTPTATTDVDVDKFGDAFDKIKEGWGGISDVGDGIQSMTQALEGNKNAWEGLSAVINSFIRITEGIRSVIKLTNQMGAAMQTASKGAAAASQTAAAAKTGEASANAASATTGAADTMASATQSAAKLPFPANIAAIAAAVAATVGVIATVMSLVKGFHNGGIVHAAIGTVVPGNNFSGDMVPAMLNSGELVLNQAQQGNIASQLDSARSFKDLRLSTEADGEVLRIILDNNGRRTGRGELVTSNIKLW